MKKLFISSCFLLLSTLSFGQWATGNAVGETAIRAVWSPSDNVVYACANYDKIYKSTNSGQDWSVNYNSNSFYFFKDIQFTDNNNGVAIGSVAASIFLILHTTDGGQNWKPTTFTPQNQLATLYGVDFATPTIGYICGSEGSVYKTTNGGANWTKSLPFITNDDLVDIDAPSANVVYVTTLFGETFKSIDGGFTFSSLTNIIFAPRKLQFLSNNQGFVLCAAGQFISTVDGGTTWEEEGQLPNATENFWMTDASNGYATTADGKILRTNNGGKTWFFQSNTPSTSKVLYDIHFSNNQKGYAVGGDDTPLIFKTTNQGGIAANFSVENLRVSQSNNFCQGDTLKLSATTIGGTSFSWKINDQIVSTQQNTNFILTKSDLNKIELQVMGNGQTVTLNQDITATAYEPQIPKISSGLFGPCENENIKLTLDELQNFSTYFVKIANKIIADDIDLSNNVIQLAPMTGNQKIEVWLKNQDCGNRKVGEHIIYYQKKPSNSLKINALINPICENTKVEINVTKSEANVKYQIYQNNLPFGKEVVGSQQNLIVNSEPLTKSTFLKVKAAASEGCFVFLKDSIKMIVKEILPLYSISAENIAIGEPINIINSSADSLNCSWNFDIGAVPNTSILKKPTPFLQNSIGAKKVSLEVTSPTGCKEILTKNYTVYDTVGLNKDWVRVQKTNVNFVNSKKLDKLAVDSLGNMYATGVSDNGYKLFSNAGEPFNGTEINVNLISKHNQQGVYQWHLIFDATFDIHEMKVAKDQKLYVLLSAKDNEKTLILPSRDGVTRTYKDTSALWIAIYSPLGILDAVHKINGLCDNYTAIKGNCFDINPNGTISLYGENLTNCNETTIQVVSNSGNVKKVKLDKNFKDFFVQISEKNKVISIETFNSLVFLGGNGYFLTPKKLISDAAQNTYTLLSNDNYDKNEAKTIGIIKIDENRNKVWEYEAKIALNSNSYYVLGHDIALTANNDIAFLASVWGITEFPPVGMQTIAAPTITMLNGTDGKQKWHRYFWTTNGSDNPPPTHPGLGLCVSGNKVFAKIRYEELSPNINSSPSCLNFERKDGQEYLFKMDTVGNLLQITENKTHWLPQNPSASPSTLFVKGKDIYSLGITQKQGNFANIPFSAPSEGNYLAHVKDDLKYLPYITTPVSKGNSIDINCTLNVCSGATSKLQVSNIFKNIKWKRNNVVIPNENKPTFYPQINGAYTVEAIDPNGQIVTSPDAVNLIVEITPKVDIKLKKDTLIAPFYKGAYYIWSDTLGNGLLLGDEKNKLVVKQNDKVSVTILNGSCSNTSPFVSLKTVSNHDIENNLQFVLSPNPSEGIFNVEFSAEKTGKIKIFNLIGQLVSENNFSQLKKWELNLSSFYDGGYILWIQNEDGQSHSKVIKQN